MLCISRWKAAAILLTVLSVSAMAIPNFLSESAFRALPKWAQHRIMPGIEYTGGTRQLLEVNAGVIRKQMVEQLRDEVRKALREARVGLVQAAVVRGDQVHVRLREDDLERGLKVLQDRLVAPSYRSVVSIRPAPNVPGTFVTSLNGAAPSPVLPDVIVEVDGTLIRLTNSENVFRERIHSARRASINIIRRRIHEMGVVGMSVEPRGSDRIEVIVPRVMGPRWFDLIG
jgi:preprotein translocase subunit SecD